MNFVKKIKKYFPILLMTALLVGCNNTDIKDVNINKTIIDNENVVVNFSSKKDNVLSFEIENKLNKEISGNLNLKLNDYEIRLSNGINCNANEKAVFDIPIIDDELYPYYEQILEKQLDFDVDRGKIEIFMIMTTLEKEIIESPKEWQEKSGQVISYERDKIVNIGSGYYCFGEIVNCFDEHVIKKIYEDESIRICLTDIYGFNCAATILIENKTNYYMEIVTEDSILVNGKYPYCSDGRYIKRYHQRLLPVSKLYDSIFANDSPTYNAEVTLKDLSISFYDSKNMPYVINHVYDDYDYSEFVFIDKKDLGTICFWVDDYYKKSNLSNVIRKCNSIEENLNNNEFQKVRNLDNMETVKFGKYEQDGNIENGKEDIEWLIVAKNDKEALLLSKDILDCKPFNTENNINEFESSYLYNWLNNYFYQEVFGDIDKNKTIIKNDIALLKYDDIVKYFGIKDDKKENEILGSCGTDYARNCIDNKDFYIEELDNMTTLATGFYLSDDCWYRNNSPYYILDKNMFCGIVECDGSIHLDDDERGNQFNIGIRPAIWIKLMHKDR